jgi:hypothetical protein
MASGKDVQDAQDPDWPAADKFVDVQVLLDQNVVLISQINDNHTTRTPEALERNVLLIRELNSNVQRITELYQDIASVLTGAKPDAAADGAATAVKVAGQKP